MGNSILMRDLGLLILRVSFGGMMFLSHGWDKLLNFGTTMHQFSDPIGLGAPLSLVLAVFAEVFCSLALVFGIFTRMAAVPLAVTMGVAAFIVHANDPWSRMEFALLYFFPFVTLALMGGGRFSADTILEKLRLKRAG
ncbi:MAG: DoxX family protein [Bdellovibrionales bacterium]|nr:DoxX family protein [Bdellovibrionales bacterium]